MQNVIKRFVQVRKFLRLTQSELALSMGFKQSYISNIEKGRNEVTSNIVIALHKLYNISPDWLITGNGEMISSVTTTIDENGEPRPFPSSMLKETTDAQRNDHLTLKYIDSLKKTIESQEVTIQLQKKVIALMENELQKLKSELVQN